ncbi:MAG: GAF domain-containing protein [Actinomycetota bacterium]|nr:GAF domain-containing protein [Actinomycetota bacterium]
MTAPVAHRIEERFLYEIISTVASSLNLEEVLVGVVRLLSEASGVHACFVYLVDRDAERLELRAASEPYGQLVGRIALERGEGVAWWALENRKPVFIRENAVADPRFKFVPELEEESFQSFVSVPVFDKAGAPIAAISLHTQAPREFTNADADFLVSVASLVAGAIENARIYDEMGLRVRELEQLTELGEAIATATTLDELGPEVVRRTLELLGASAAHLYLVDNDERLRLRWSAPPSATAPHSIGLGEAGPELARSGRSTRVAVMLVADGELLGLLSANDTRELDLARAAANQTALAIKKIELIERLAEKNLIKDFFEQLSGGKVLGNLTSRAERLGIDLDEPHLVVLAVPASEQLERALAGVAPRSLFDRQDNATRGLLRVPPAGAKSLVDAIKRTHAELEVPASVGISNVCADPASFRAGFEEAGHALVGTTVLRGNPPLLTYEELGAYKYLLRMSLDAGARDRHREAVARLAEYDEAHSTALLPTLEEFLSRRGTITATAEALYIHPNTLRQRLRRIRELTGLDLRKEDWLMVEIAVKLAALQRAMQGRPDIPGAAQV